MTHQKENNALFEQILKTKILNEDSTISLNLLFSTDYLLCTNCSICNNLNKNQVDLESIMGNFNTLLNYLKNNNYFSNKLSLTINNWDPKFAFRLLDNLQKFYIDYPLSNKIEIITDFRLLILPVRTELAFIISKFKNLNIDITFNTLLQNSRDLQSEEFNFLLNYPRSQVNYIINRDTITTIIDTDDRLGTIHNIKFNYIEDFTNWTDTHFNFYHEFMDYILSGTASRIYDKIYNEDRYKILRLNIFDSYNCNLQTHCNIRLEDLAIIPCSGLNEDKFILGRITSDSICANNVEFASMLYFANTNQMLPTCDTCAYKVLCPKGCPATNFANTRDLFLPDPTYCQAIQRKLNILAELYNKIGLKEFIMSKQF